MCCGTHVSNLGVGAVVPCRPHSIKYIAAQDLQAVKLLYFEPNKGGSRLYFVAGTRVLSLLDTLFAEVRLMLCHACISRVFCRVAP